MIEPLKNVTAIRGSRTLCAKFVNIVQKIRSLTRSLTHTHTNIVSLAINKMISLDSLAHPIMKWFKRRSVNFKI